MSHWQGNHPPTSMRDYQYPPTGPDGRPPYPAERPPHHLGGHRGANVSLEVLIAVVASVCGLLLTSALSESTPELALAGMVLGAAIPPFVSTAGGRRGFRVTIAVLVTSVAVCVTYAGSIVVSTITQEETLPGSTVLTDVIRSPTTPPHSPTSVEGSTGSMEVTPGTLRCTPDCESPVTIRNTSGARFAIDDIIVDGEDVKSFSYDDGCVGVKLGDSEKCEFTVEFDPNDTDYEATATLLVRNDLTENNEARVDLFGHSPSGIDLAIAAGDVSCTYEAADAEGANGSLSVAFLVIVTETYESGEIPVAVSSNSGAYDTTVFVGAGSGETAITLPVDGADRDEHMIKINVDPGNEIPEADESNNDAEAYCAVRSPVHNARKSRNTRASPGPRSPSLITHRATPGFIRSFGLAFVTQIRQGAETAQC